MKVVCTKFNKNIIAGIAAILITLIMLTSGCVDKSAEQAEPTQIAVSAAASLTEAFYEIEKEFEADNPMIDVTLNMAGSGTLRMQIEAGAPIDVFASASQKHMNLLDEKKLIDEETREDFAANTVVLITPIASELDINNPEDLTKPEVKTISIGNPETAPVGKYTIESLTESGIWPEIQSKNIPAENVKQILVYVERNDVDAGFVYKTDAMTAEENSIKIAATIPSVTAISYPIAVLSTSEHKNESQKFIDFTTSEEGRTILESYGFIA